MDLMTVTETAQLWGLTKRRVQAMCKTGQTSAQRLGNIWVFPKDTSRPVSGRVKAAKAQKEGK